MTGLRHGEVLPDELLLLEELEDAPLVPPEKDEAPPLADPLLLDEDTPPLALEDVLTTPEEPPDDVPMGSRQLLLKHSCGEVQSESVLQTLSSTTSSEGLGGQANAPATSTSHPHLAAFICTATPLPGTWQATPRR